MNITIEKKNIDLAKNKPFSHELLRIIIVSSINSCPIKNR